MKKLQELERNGDLYRGLVNYIQSLMKHYFELFRVHKRKLVVFTVLACRTYRRGFFSELGDVFSEIAVRESLERANHAFIKYGEAHRCMAKTGVKMLKIMKPVG